ncbi:YceI family protein [Mycolicibacterium diernhoferi]|uniref:S-adenosyl-L-methionine-dependent methyltransferase n=1 Tax=Mycolicibacterium diernhoferi TaxID=1801 RepID=A0A2A7NWN5_9MYCO|nr:YceI family protein [Mycolicibacterium diernhoferi]PEG54801.1 S-adenosyl-L-methionine-dependent methyltransferase [Mycolicibacterium diernhoferi]QYL23023.1 YceI family protein [Mycolicibacterium diernhoferi]
MTEWIVGPDSGELLIHTGVTGRAARMGHRLTIAMGRWQAVLRDEDGHLRGVELTVDLDSLSVLRGEGGVTPLSGPEKVLVVANAMKLFRVQRFPQARFASTDVESAGETLRVSGTLDLNGHTGAQTVDVRVEDAGEFWRLSGRARVRHSEFGIKQYSMLMGAMKVADEVDVTLTATVAKDRT